MVELVANRQGELVTPQIKSALLQHALIQHSRSIRRNLRFHGFRKHRSSEKKSCQDYGLILGLLVGFAQDLFSKMSCGKFLRPWGLVRVVQTSLKVWYSSRSLSLIFQETIGVESSYLHILACLGAKWFQIDRELENEGIPLHLDLFLLVKFLFTVLFFFSVKITREFV